MSYLKDKLFTLLLSEPVVVEPWRKALLDAADVLRRDGWNRCYFTSPEGRHCVNGALQRTDSSYEAQMIAARRLSLFLCLPATLDHNSEPISPSCALLFWNDKQNSDEPVLRALTECARHG